MLVPPPPPPEKPPPPKLEPPPKPVLPELTAIGGMAAVVMWSTCPVIQKGLHIQFGPAYQIGGVSGRRPSSISRWHTFAHRWLAEGGQEHRDPTQAHTDPDALQRDAQDAAS